MILNIFQNVENVYRTLNEHVLNIQVLKHKNSQFNF